MSDTIQYDTTHNSRQDYSSKGGFLPEQKTDFIYTTTTVEGGFFAAFAVEALLISFTIVNFILLIIIFRKLRRIEKKLK